MLLSITCYLKNYKLWFLFNVRLNPVTAGYFPNEIKSFWHTFTMLKLLNYSHYFKVITLLRAQLTFSKNRWTKSFNSISIRIKRYIRWYVTYTRTFDFFCTNNFEVKWLGMNFWWDFLPYNQWILIYLMTSTLFLPLHFYVINAVLVFLTKLL